MGCLMGSGCQTVFLLGASSIGSFHDRIMGGLLALNIKDEDPGGFTWVGDSYLYEMTGKYESEIRKDMRRLEDAGVIIVERRPGTRSRRSINWAALNWEWREYLD